MARVLLFGRFRDLAGWREREVQAASVVALKALLTSEDPDLGAALAGKGVQVAVNQAIVKGDRALDADAEVAFLPPMSGG